MSELLPPCFAQDVLITPDVRTKINAAMVSGAIEGAWLLTGPPQIGKASLAYVIAKAVLSGAKELGQSNDRTTAWVHNSGHPDLFIIERTISESTGRLSAEITVDAVRKIIAGLHLTSSCGRRVVIVDLADHFGHSAANALLKSLEEPPAGTTMLLLSAAPGRLLPTIKSRCRRLPLHPIADDIMLNWLNEKTQLSASENAAIVASSTGRPGAALALSQGEGQIARNLSQKFLSALRSRDQQSMIAAAALLAAKDAETDAAWPVARQLILDHVRDLIRKTPDARNIGRKLTAYDRAVTLARNAERLNADRQHTALMLGFSLREIIGDQHVG